MILGITSKKELKKDDFVELLEKAVWVSENNQISVALENKMGKENYEIYLRKTNFPELHNMIKTVCKERNLDLKGYIQNFLEKNELVLNNDSKNEKLYNNTYTSTFENEKLFEALNGYLTRRFMSIGEYGIDATEYLGRAYHDDNTKVLIFDDNLLK